MGRISNVPVTYIQAVVESTQPDRTQYKPYVSTLSFDGKLIVEIPVPTSELRKEGDKIVLTLQGWTTFLKNYTDAIDQMNNEYRNQFR